MNPNKLARDSQVNAGNLESTIAKLQREVNVLALIKKHQMGLYKGIGGWVAEANQEGREGHSRTVRSFYPTLDEAVEALAKMLE